MDRFSTGLSTEAYYTPRAAFKQLGCMVFVFGCANLLLTGTISGVKDAGFELDVVSPIRVMVPTHPSRTSGFVGDDSTKEDKGSNTV